MTLTANLAGKTALITGASSGLGRHFAGVLAVAGADVIVGARRVDLVRDLAAELRTRGYRAEAIALDVTDAASIAAAAPEIAKVDILVNNAGIARDSRLIDLTEEDWDAVVDTNFKGVHLMTQAVARALRSRGAPGSIINVASILGLRQGATVGAYAASKAATIQLTKVAALELARYSIRVNALAPGYVATDLNMAFFESDAGRAMVRRIPQQRLGRPDNLDGPLLLLASDSSAYMTGSVIVVDGGHLVSTL